MLRSTHLAAVKNLEDRLADQARQALRFQELLQSQIEDLKRLVYVPTHTPSIEVLEADAVIGVSEKAPSMSEEELHKILRGERELDLMLSGNYDLDLVSE